MQMHIYDSYCHIRRIHYFYKTIFMTVCRLLGVYLPMRIVLHGIESTPGELLCTSDGRMCAIKDEDQICSWHQGLYTARVTCE